jgi:hypothetical protein
MRGARPRALLLAAVALAVLSQASCSECAAMCVGQLEVHFEQPITGDGLWTFEITGGDGAPEWSPCTVELPGGNTACGSVDHGQGRLSVEVRDGEIRRLTLAGAEPTPVRISIYRDEGLILSLSLEPAYIARELCGTTCYDAGIYLSF